MRRVSWLLAAVALGACATAPVRDVASMTPAQRACVSERDACENRCFSTGMSSLTLNPMYDQGRYNICAGGCRSDEEHCLLSAGYDTAPKR
jgi:hypothetical protein